MVYEDERTPGYDVVDDDEALEGNVRVTGTDAVETVHNGFHTGACPRTCFTTEVEDGEDAIFRWRRVGSPRGGSYDGFVDLRYSAFG